MAYRGTMTMILTTILTSPELGTLIISFKGPPLEDRLAVTFELKKNGHC